MQRLVIVLSEKVANNLTALQGSAEEIVRDFSSVLAENPEFLEVDDGNVMKFMIEFASDDQAEPIKAALVAVLVRHGFEPQA